MVIFLTQFELYQQTENNFSERHFVSVKVVKEIASDMNLVERVYALSIYKQ